MDLIDLAVPAATNVCRKESTDQNVTTCTRNKEAAQEEACKTEDHVQEDYGPYQRATSGGYGNLFTEK